MEAYKLPASTHAFWKIAKGSILYVRCNKPRPCQKGRRGKVVRVIHCKAGGSTNGANNLMLLGLIE